MAYYIENLILNLMSVIGYSWFDTGTEERVLERDLRKMAEIQIPPQSEIEEEDKVLTSKWT